MAKGKKISGENSFRENAGIVQALVQNGKENFPHLVYDANGQILASDPGAYARYESQFPVARYLPSTIIPRKIMGDMNVPAIIYREESDTDFQPYIPIYPGQPQGKLASAHEISHNIQEQQNKRIQAQRDTMLLNDEYLTDLGVSFVPAWGERNTETIGSGLENYINSTAAHQDSVLKGLTLPQGAALLKQWRPNKQELIEEQKKRAEIIASEYLNNVTQPDKNLYKLPLKKLYLTNELQRPNPDEQKNVREK
jgi:hypothetical protein